MQGMDGSTPLLLLLPRKKVFQSSDIRLKQKIGWIEGTRGVKNVLSGGGAIKIIPEKKKTLFEKVF